VFFSPLFRLFQNLRPIHDNATLDAILSLSPAGQEDSLSLTVKLMNILNARNSFGAVELSAMKNDNTFLFVNANTGAYPTINGCASVSLEDFCSALPSLSLPFSLPSIFSSNNQNDRPSPPHNPIEHSLYAISSFTTQLSTGRQYFRIHSAALGVGCSSHHEFYDPASPLFDGMFALQLSPSNAKPRWIGHVLMELPLQRMQDQDDPAIQKEWISGQELPLTKEPFLLTFAAETMHHPLEHTNSLSSSGISDMHSIHPSEQYTLSGLQDTPFALASVALSGPRSFFENEMDRRADYFRSRDWRFALLASLSSPEKNVHTHVEQQRRPYVYPSSVSLAYHQHFQISPKVFAECGGVWSFLAQQRQSDGSNPVPASLTAATRWYIQLPLHAIADISAKYSLGFEGSFVQCGGKLMSPLNGMGHLSLSANLTVGNTNTPSGFISSFRVEYSYP